MSGFVWAYNARGEKKRVPAHWIGHPVITGWTKTPRQKAREAKKKATKPPARGDDTKEES
jgi:hypothetical protein